MDRIDLLSLFNKPNRISNKQSPKNSIIDQTRENLHICRISEELRPWSVLVPSYCPSSYSKPIKEFNPDIQKIVQENSAQVTHYVKCIKSLEFNRTWKTLEKKKTFGIAL